MTTATRPRRGQAAQAAQAEPASRELPIPAISGASRPVLNALESARRNPRSVDQRHVLADALRAAAFAGEAIDCYRTVIAMHPDRGTAYRDLGNVLVDNGRIDDGLAALRRAVELLPNEPGALLGLIRAMQKAGTAADAVPLVERLGREAASHAKDARRHLYHGLALSQLGRIDDAIAGVRAALALNDSDAEAWDFLGLLLVDRRDYHEARAAYDRALTLVPGRPQTLFNRATLRLKLGDYAGGFADYEGRWDSPHFTTARHEYGVPRWGGEPLQGRTLLVHTEQGLGDTMQFVRFIGHARAAGAGRVVLECEDSLARLLSALEGVDQVVRRGEPLPRVDLHVPLMSLAHFAGATVETVTPAAPYLGVELPSRILPPRSAATRLRIGIVFEASKGGGSYRNKSMSIDAFAPLAERSDVELFSLQKGPGEQRLADSPLRTRIADIGSRLVDFRDTAEVIAQLDLVISVDTSTCHLAGAMGTPVWTLIPATTVSDWRWLIDRTDSPWYPTMRLFRQSEGDDGTAIMAQVMAALDSATPQAPRFDARFDARFAPRAAVTADVHVLIALKHTEQGEYLAAAGAYNAALLLDPRNADLWNNFGVVLAKADRLRDSHAAFAQAVALAPAHADANRNMKAVAAAWGGIRPAAQGDPSRPRLALDWQVGATSGWGIYGLNLVMHTLRRREFTPVLFYDPELGSATPQHRAALEHLSARSTDATLALQQGGSCPFPVMHALGNGFHSGSLGAQLHGTRRLGMIFFEDTRLLPDAISRAHTYDRIVAGSTWNAEVLRAHGLEQTVLVIQGIDTSVFHPALRTGKLGHRFVVFSGGKLEYRKGQDLVVAAFARFRQRHPDAVLMVAWHNHWPQTMAEIVTAGHVRDVPTMNAARQLDVTAWLVRHGIPAEAVLDLGVVPNAAMAAWVREADVALFPNRAEGGTNLVAMEALASGVPCILSANTGHLDLTADEHNIVLHAQGRCQPTAGFAGTEGWGESSVDEIVEALEFAYRERDECQRRAADAAAVMAGASWHNQIDRLFDAVGDVLV